MISVIVPARDEAATVGECIEALLGQEGLSVPLEIIVIDDGSVDGTVDSVRKAAAGHLALVAAGAPGDPPASSDARERTVTLVPGPGRGAAGARNAGARAAQGELLLFTDADCRPAPDWAARLVGAVSGLGVVGAMGVQHSDQRSLVARVVQAELDQKQAELLAHRRVTFGDTATVAYRADVFRAAGGFDVRLVHFEDTELAFRLAAAGHKLAMTPDAVVCHRHPESVWAYAARKFRIGYWGALVYRRFPGHVRDDSRTPASMKAQLAAAGLVLVALKAAGVLAALGSAQAGVVWGVTLAVGLFLATCVPFLPYARRHGWDVLVLAPFLLFLRAVVIGAGLAVGLVALAAGRHRGLARVPQAAS